jgi:hypothetical protein
VIAAGLGTDPDNGYAYCNAPSTDQNVPNGGCDGQWMVGPPIFGSNHTLKTIDPDFKIMPGGCPQITCSSITFWSESSDEFTPNYNSGTTFRTGTFDYDAPNTYRQSGAATPTGYWYLFWNYKAWTWAINFKTDDFERCEYYKSASNFLLVGEVMGGPYDNYINYTTGVWFFHSVVNPGSQRVMQCTGTQPTPQPTAQAIGVPTKAPGDTNICWMVGYAPTWQPSIDAHCLTPAPVVIHQFTAPPTPEPSDAVFPTPPPVDPTPQPTGNTGNPTPGPTVTFGNPSRAPTKRPTTRPPTTPGPTVPYGYPSRPPTQRPTIVGDGGEISTTDGVAAANCNMYLVCVVVAIYKLL